MKRQDWIFLGVCLVIFGLLYFLTIREGFVSVNPLPTQADLDSFKYSSTSQTYVGTPTPTLQKILDFGKNLPWKSGTSDNDIVINTMNAINGGFNTIPTIANKYTTRPSFQQVINDLSKENPNNDFFKNGIVIQNGPTDNQITPYSPGAWYAIYKYVFGDEPSSSPASSPASAPVPAPSTTVNIPSPCHPGTRSIPGGYLETRCFNS